MEVGTARAASRYERLGSYLLPTGQREQGLAALRRAVELVPEQPPTAERVRVLAALGNALLLSARYDESREACQQALDLAATLGDRRSAFRAADVLAAALCYLGRLDEGLALLYAACEPDPERDTTSYLLRPYVHLSDALMLAGRLPDAVRIADEGLMIARRLGVERGAGTVLASNLAEALLGTGDWERAADVLTTSLRNGGSFWSHYPHIHYAQLAIWRGEFDTAREHLQAGAQAAIEPPTAPTYALLHAELAAWQGRIADAADAVDEALRQAESIGTVTSRPQSCALGLRVEADRTRLAIARRDASHDRPGEAPSPAAPAGRQAVRPPGRRPDPGRHCLAGRCRGRVRQRGRTAEAGPLAGLRRRPGKRSIGRTMSRIASGNSPPP